jgi:hypothetical protein
VAVLGGVLLLQPLAPRLPGPAAELVRSLGDSRLSRPDEALLERGYYEELTLKSGSFAQWQAPAQRDQRAGPALREAGAYLPREDFLAEELAPNLALEAWGERFTTNRWGMRDRDYERDKADGSHRIAVLGPSFAMGFAVGDGEAFEAVLEERLNRDHAGGRFARYEVLNFSVVNYTPIHYAVVLEERAAAFRPDLVLVAVDPFFRSKMLQAIVGALRAGLPLPFAELDSLVRAARVDRDTDPTTALRRLSLEGDRILDLTFARLGRTAALAGAKLALVVVRMPTTRGGSDRGALALAAGHGFEIFDLSDAYQGHDEDTLAVSGEDHHQNPAGHRLLAEALYRQLVARNEPLGLGFGARPAAPAGDRR